MPKKKTETQEVIEKIFDYTLEDIMGERFGSYSKYIIQERAIPDARDGLKPVQRRILYSMHREKNTYDKGYRKSAKTVGDVIGNFHPHGDTSIYEAMVRMSQPWKTRLPYIDMHGNNGSIDGDGPAAYRYTEARLSKIANEMLRDIDRDTVDFAPNFDDTVMEPTVLPARFPALLVYGSQGISAGYATNIPTHNLNEIVDAAIYRIENPNSTLEELMEIVKGPDFPTGGIVEGLEGLKEAYTTGKGRIIIKSRYTIEEEKGNKRIVITEIPFEVNKALMVKKIDDIRIDKKIDGIIEVRDESTSDVRVVIDVRKTADVDLIIKYLLKNTDMQISYNYNVVAILNKRPKLLGLADCLDAFLAHQKEVIRRRSEFDLKHAKARYHIVEGLIKCISILDEVIRVIRESKNRADSKQNLIDKFGFTPEQSEAIITLQLYRLSNTDVVALQEEKEKLETLIQGLLEILGNEKKLQSVMKRELKEINKEYVTPRLTDIKDEITEIKIDTEQMIPKEDVIVLLTKDGYIKRTSLRSYQASADEDLTIKENDYVIGKYNMNTKDTFLVFTNYGNYLQLPVFTIPDLKWKDMPKHISNLIALSPGEEVVGCIPAYDFNKKTNIIIGTAKGMIKKTPLSVFKQTRYNKPITCMKLKDGDKVIGVVEGIKPYIMLSTNSGYGLTYNIEEISEVGLKTSGVKSMSLKGDEINSISNFSYETDEFIVLVTDRGTGKRIRLSELPAMARARRGLQIIREVKKSPYTVIGTIITTNKDYVGYRSDIINEIKVTELPIADRYSTGSQISKNNINAIFKVSKLEENEEEIIQEELPIPQTKEISLEEIDDKLMTIDDFLK